MTCYTVLYPGLRSIKAIESAKKDDDKVWLTYWMIFGMLHVAETFLGFVFYFIPYWSWIRVGFFIWLIQFNGSQQLYQTVLRDILTQNKELIKDFIARFRSVADSAAKEAGKAVSDPQNMAKVITAAAQVQSKANEVFEEP